MADSINGQATPLLDKSDEELHPISTDNGDVPTSTSATLASQSPSHASAQNTVSSDGDNGNGDVGGGKVEIFLRTAAMMGMIALGLSVLVAIFFWPTVVAWKLLPPMRWARKLGWTIMIETLHLAGLIFVDIPYLYLHRKLFLPMRIPLMPVLNFIVKSEAIREGSMPWYNDCKGFSRPRIRQQTNGAASTLVDISPILQRFKGSVRKDVRKKLPLYHQHGITSQTAHSDYLSLYRDIPIIWDHERRCCRNSGKDSVGAVLDDFLQRFLVIFLVSNAYIDRYYDPDGNLCALGMFVACDKVYINNMYFCVDSARSSGIWQYHHVRGLARAVVAHHEGLESHHGTPTIEYVNFYHHQDFAKRMAGAVAADVTHAPLMKELFPFRLYREPPTQVIDATIDLEALLVGKKSHEKAETLN
jgi:hypothetical protein